YLCVKVDWPPLKKKLKNAKRELIVQGLPPLRISFKTDRPFVPLKFTSEFDFFANVKFVTFTQKPIDWLKSAVFLKQLGVYQLYDLDPWSTQNSAVSPSKFKDALKASYQEIIKEKRLSESKHWYYNVIFSDDLNNFLDNPISNWKSDFYLELNDDPHRLKVRQLLKKAVRHISVGPRTLDKNAVAALRKMGKKAVPGILQALARIRNHSVHTLGLSLVKDYPDKITAPFLEAELNSISETHSYKEGTRYLVLGEMLIDRKDKRGIEILIRHGIDGWKDSDRFFGSPNRLEYRKRIWALLEKATGKSFGKPKKLRKYAQTDPDDPWTDWYWENEDELQWDKDKKLFVVKK
ncbi:MAG: hypothetical protein P1V97_38760, partial [Planctomycetota bacterium]|nr:hypothetical protein [Planctomycetota bacterium]